METDKIDALNRVQALLEQQVEKMTSPPLPWEPKDSLSLEQLQDLRAEVLAHAELLGYAHIACTMGQKGQEPDGWQEENEGQPFDHHAAATEALASLLGAGQLSPALRAYLEELPSRLQRAHDSYVAYARADTRLLPNNTMKQWSERQVGRESMAVVTKGLEATAFVESYDADVAQALKLAQQRADWADILACLA